MAISDAGKLWYVDRNTVYTFPGTDALAGYRYEFFNIDSVNMTISFATGANLQTAAGFANGPFQIIIPAGTHVVVIAMGQGSYIAYQNDKVGQVLG
jgi:hypothetical protein